MSRSASKTFLAASLLTLGLTGAVATDSPAPYQTIVHRNPFGLKPPATAPSGTAETTANKPLPPIALTGLASLADRRWACFNLAPPGKPARSLKLALGQLEGDVQLLSVNLRDSTVEILHCGQPFRLALQGAPAQRLVAAEIKDRLEMEEHTRATEAHQRRERLREQEELAAAGLAPKP